MRYILITLTLTIIYCTDIREEHKKACLLGFRAAIGYYNVEEHVSLKDIKNESLEVCNHWWLDNLNATVSEDK